MVMLALGRPRDYKKPITIFIGVIGGLVMIIWGSILLWEIIENAFNT